MTVEYLPLKHQYFKYMHFITTTKIFLYIIVMDSTRNNICVPSAPPAEPRKRFPRLSAHQWQLSEQIFQSYFSKPLKGRAFKITCNLNKGVSLGFLLLMMFGFLFSSRLKIFPTSSLCLLKFASLKSTVCLAPTLEDFHLHIFHS